MNYPFGENIFFSPCQPLISNSVKFISKFHDISGAVVGITNLIMLFSIVASSLFLYLIFKELGLPSVYSSLAATGIAFLSPQIQRLCGHYTLTYQFAIPALIYLLFKFHSFPSIKKSLLIALLTFFMASTHLYFFAIFAAMTLFYWIAMYFSKENPFHNFAFCIKHFSIQMFLPFLLIESIMVFSNSVYDRTSTPWGFLYYKSAWQSVFLPLGHPLGNLLNKFFTIPELQWEGIAYIGLVSTIVFVAIFFIPLLRWKKSLAASQQRTKEKERRLMPSDNKVLNIFFWASLLILVYSFGIPFIFHMNFLLDYIGFLKQMRAIGRFAWVFYYVMNILAFYLVYHWANKIHVPLLRGIKGEVKIYLTSAILILSYDVYYQVNILPAEILNNHIVQLEDSENLLPENQWLKKINVSDFQAIIPLPYFHIGSENIWINPSSQIFKDAYIVSLKTGIPITAVSSSRTSLSQTYKNIALVMEPNEDLKILKDFPNHLPFLVIACENDIVNEPEKHLLSLCTPLFKTSIFNVYQLNYDQLSSLTKSLYNMTKEEFVSKKTTIIDKFFSTDSIKNFVLNNFDDSIYQYSFNGKGTYRRSIRDINTIFYGTPPNLKANEKYVFSFWMKDFQKDLYPRSTIEITFIDSAGQNYRVNYSNPHKIFKRFQGDWTLLEKEIIFKNKNDKIKITIWNSDLAKKDTLTIDDFLIRPALTDLYEIGDKEINKNNRHFQNEK